jgi:hypothetical protein
MKNKSYNNIHTIINIYIYILAWRRIEGVEERREEKEREVDFFTYGEEE